MLFTQFMLYILLFLQFSIGNAVIHHKLFLHESKFIRNSLSPYTKLVIRQAPANLKPCNEDDLMVYLAEMQAINPESIINLCTEDDFGTMCTQVSQGLDKIDDFLETCQIVNDKDLYIQLIKGVDKFYDYLCNTTSHKEAFQKYFLCYRSLREEYESCAGPADWTEYKEHEQVCKSYREIVDCYYIKTAKICGLNAAKIIKDLMKNVINVILTTTCDISANPYVADPMPESGGQQKVSVCILLLVAFVLNIIADSINFCSVTYL